MTAPLLQVSNLSVEFDTYGGTVKAVRDVSFSVQRGSTLAIVGESGCGKSVTVQALMGLTPAPPGRVTKGSALLDGEEIIGIDEKSLNQIRGKRIGMIFQDAMSALNPTMSIGKQISETLIVHQQLNAKQAMNKAVELLTLVQIPDAEKRSKQYPFEFSGGMLQRAMIAMSLACEPDVLIADEPTTALDVTIQAQILDLLKTLQQQQQLTIILITHDLGVVAQLAHEVAVMYAGQIVEQGQVDDVFYQSSHPYTQGLKEAMPNNSSTKQSLTVIEGSPPDLFSPPAGCGFCKRCNHAMQLCEAQLPNLANLSPQSSHQARCWLHHEQAPANRFRDQKLGNEDA